MGHPPHHPAPLTGDARYADIRFVTLVGSAVDLLLGVVKLIFGYLAQSQALIADGIHSLSDLGTDFMVLWAAKHSSRGADESHPYGHQRIETLATVALGIALILVALGIAWDAGQRLFNPDQLLHPGGMALVIAAVSVVSKEIIYHYTLRAAKRHKSHLLAANAWHSRSDAISSVVVMIGVGGAMLGLTYLDAVAAIIVGVMIAKIGWDLSWASLQELADAALDQERVEAIRDTILSIGGVRAIHMLRTRRMGGDALVDVHVLVEPKLSVSEGHFISEKVRATLIAEIDEVADVTVHIDPEDDEHMRPSAALPSREELLKRLHHQWRDLEEDARIERITLHYLDGRVHVEVLLPINILANHLDASTVANRLVHAVAADPLIAKVDVRFH